MNWLRSYFSFLLLRPWKELKRSKWYMVFTALQAISTVLTFLGIFVALRIPLPGWSATTWLILFLLSIISTLLLLIEGLRRYDVRTSNEIRAEWARRFKANEVLSEKIARGEVLYRSLDSVTYQSDTQLAEHIDQWHRGVASALLYDSGLGESYRDMFYKRSNTGDRTPPLNECLAWMHDRLVILKEFRQELEPPPKQISEYSDTQVYEKPQLRG